MEKKTIIDKRVKLDEFDRLNIRQQHKNDVSISELSRQFKVDRRTIQFIVSPEKYAINKKLTAQATKKRQALGVDLLETKRARLEQYREKRTKLETELREVVVKIRGIENFLESQS
jgi:IS30 family transposase